MARIAVEDGIQVMACTPHITPGLYNNTGPSIRALVTELQALLSEADIPLDLVTGADVHIAPDLVVGLESGRVLSLADSRYFLLEPSQTLPPPRFIDLIFDLTRAGYVPVITHPERFRWIEAHYETIREVVRIGAWTQLTAGSLLGTFGSRARYWSERMLDDSLVHIIATDAHNTTRRSPLLSPARDAAANRVGEAEAHHMVATRPAGVLANAGPSELPPLTPPESSAVEGEGLWRRLRRSWGGQD